MTKQEREPLLYPVKICSSSELQPGQRKMVEIDGVGIVIVNVEGNLYAFRNNCPHQGAPMFYGSITGTMIPSKPKEYHYGCDNKIIRCPLHGWEFELETGKSLFAPEQVSIITYQVYEKKGAIVLYMKKEPKRICIVH